MIFFLVCFASCKDFHEMTFGQLYKQRTLPLHGGGSPPFARREGACSGSDICMKPWINTGPISVYFSIRAQTLFSVTSWPEAMLAGPCFTLYCDLVCPGAVLCPGGMLAGSLALW